MKYVLAILLLMSPITVIAQESSEKFSRQERVEHFKEKCAEDPVKCERIKQRHADHQAKCRENPQKCQERRTRAHEKRQGNNKGKRE